jgi:hypothetical protein
MKVKEELCKIGYIDACGYFTDTSAAATYNKFGGINNSAVKYNGKTYCNWNWIDANTIEIYESSIVE